jgi:methylthioribulose-1-phosphate dehydratase
MELKEPEIKLLQEKLIAVINIFHQKGWSPATSTNYSFRNEDKETYTISVSGIDKGQFSTSDLMIIDKSGKAMPAFKYANPSQETLLHIILYKNPMTNAVLHTHSVASTVISRRLATQKGVFLSGYEILKGLVGINTHDTEVFIPIFPNSQDMTALSKEIEKYYQENPEMYGFLLEGHGLYSWGKTIEEAKRHIEVLEFLFECELA